MKNKIVVTALIIIIMIQIIIPIKVMAFEQETATVTSEKSIFDPNITYSWKWVNDGSLGSKGTGVLTPSNADEYESLPAIVWLHGSGGATQDGGKTIKNTGLPSLLLKKNPELENFSAYIFCPQNTDPSNAGMWTSMDQRIKKYIKEYNLDPNNIVIAGASLGGNGTVAIAKKQAEYLSKAVVISSDTQLSKLIPIPTIWYVGYSEPAGYVDAAKKYDEIDEKKDVCWLNCDHNGATGMAYNKDDGEFVGIANNNRSDLVEWMFEGYEPKLKLGLDITSITLPSKQIKQLNVLASEGTTIETIVWTSSDTTVAVVDADGLITALKEGQTTITAKVGTKELTCQVTVSGQLGDVDKDGNITSFDAYKALKASVDNLIGAEIDEQTILTSDVNKNQKLESEDAYEILKYSVGLIDKF